MSDDKPRLHAATYLDGDDLPQADPCYCPLAYNHPAKEVTK